ncbi:hypothetical protein [Peterkaempfera griseoplana]|uniref:hypothetical protein n=1 Tax=Peterkaempfera griseoplana TaxID=66896 RepID=UPI0006E37BEB|nr:hypothetical protein [Peterkaempfera griseoplana]BCN13447.1 hypothetical protein [Peterkaempfera griseoplana]
MNTTEPQAVLTRTPVLGVPVRQPTTASPYWHREQPLVAVTHVDPDHAGLREQFPRSWHHLVRLKGLIDGIAALEAPAAVGPALHLQRISPLLTAAAHELLQFAEAEQAEHSREAVAQARIAADRLLHYAFTQEWKPVVLRQPEPDRPWLYCGPLSTWAMHTVHSPLALLVVLPRADLQSEIEAVDARLPEIQPVVARVLGSGVKSVQQVNPTMQIADLLLAGGESRVGHKNFAHFFPLEAPGSTVDGSEFTVVFANVHTSRLERCSLKLLGRLQPSAAGQGDLDEVLRASLRWFRCHDLAHFWRRSVVDGSGRPAPGLTPFEQMTLEETYADVLGLLSAVSFFPTPSLGKAFIAELLRYLSRRHHHFADSGAAALAAGWLIESGISLPPTDAHWLDKAEPRLEELADCLHGALWDADPAHLDALRAALAVGVSFREDLTELFQLIPTDLDYIFG